MKKIYAGEAFKFGFKTFFRNPLFLFIAFILTKMFWGVGILISFLISVPYFLPFFRAISKIIELVKHLISIVLTKFLPLKGLLPGAGGLREVVGGIGEAASQGGAQEGGGGLLGGIFGGIGQTVKGVATAGPKLVGAGKAVSGAIEGVKDLKEIALNILKTPQILFLFLTGVVIFVLLVKILYDYLILGWSKLSLDFSKHGRSEFSTLFAKPMLFFKYFLGTIFFVIAVWLPSTLMFIIAPLPKGFFLGGVLCVIVGFYISLSLWFYPYFIIDKHACVLEAFRSSYKLKGSILNLLLLHLIIFAIVLPITVLAIFLFPYLGFFISWFIFGICVAIMWMITFLSTAYLYMKLSRQE